ncbi:hypothetical protein T03_15441 [Trichinella britovi]|uniref:Uncharacterized protein n=1 Tax=Trichinella britovi TaxID=45882 RepID=A0A0V1D4F6_TRIBR|nr:hypothetical protein T03_15441 [Trichinella britovi]
MGSSYIPLQEVHRPWFEYRIEIKKEPYQHISQEQPVSHRRMAIFDCMPVEITVAIELKSNKEGVTHIMCTLAEEWLCGIGFRSAVMTTRVIITYLLVLYLVINNRRHMTSHYSAGQN